MSQLPPGHQYIGRCGTQAQKRYLRRRTANLPAMPAQRARLSAWLDNEPKAPATVRELKELIVLNLAVTAADSTGVGIEPALTAVLDRLEREQATLPSVTQYGFLTHQAELMTI